MHKLVDHFFSSLPLGGLVPFEKKEKGKREERKIAHRIGAVGKKKKKKREP